ncbi:hypothetical protein CCR75_005008 [Bremia lactucae]|uniref:NOT2/NOT3/NOT5 C-terminal domain-containing protein n=1 Tax=Bremia lactucae TaxID=4779 RepID=A0A976FMI5_BRELC|nr:hypothetical protein CCR75_005008 [Bremia lactucae]
MGSMSLEASFAGSVVADPIRARHSEFVIQKEDFPALSTFGPVSSGKSTIGSLVESKRHSSFTSSAADGMLLSRLDQQKGSTLIGSRAGGATHAAAGAGISGSINLGTQAFNHFRAPRPDDQNVEKNSTTNSELDPNNQYGLLGLLHTIIRPGNSDLMKNLAMGCDLTSLGLNLNKAEPLYPTFASPWSEEQLTKEPQFSLPTCYYNQPPVLKTTHLSKFHLETLFFIFYSMPKDVLQAYAAQELYSRDWRYHANLKTWFKRASSSDAALLNGNGSASTGGSTNGSPKAGSGSGSIGSIGSAPSSNAGQLNASTTLQFLYFDIATWERRVFTGNINSLSAGLVSEEDIRVKFNASSSHPTMDYTLASTQNALAARKLLVNHVLIALNAPVVPACVLRARAFRPAAFQFEQLYLLLLAQVETWQLRAFARGNIS